MSRPFPDGTGALGAWPARAGQASAPGPAGALRVALALLIAAGLVAGVRIVGEVPGGGALSFSLVTGALFGFVLQRSRFCFYCIWRDWLIERDPRGLVGIGTALAVGVAGYTAVFGAFLPDPSGSRLPPQAHIGPVGPVLVLAGLSFGAGMAISGSCISAHLYRLGEGSPTAPFALAGTALGFVGGFLAWNDLFLASLSESPVLWMPRTFGYAAALALALAVLAGFVLALLRFWTTPHLSGAGPLRPWRAVFIDRWPTWAGGLAVGALGVVAYFRVGPLGVTSEIGARSRELASSLGFLPARLEGLDGFRGCATIVRETLLTPNGLFVGGLVLASFAAALVAGQFKPAWPTWGQAARGLLGGVLLGFGAMVGLGCSVGTFLSGVSAGAVSGWVFGAAMFAGAAAVLLAGRRVGLLS